MLTTTSDEIAAALKAREQARTFRSKVGVAFSMFDGRIFGGFNIEKYGYGGYHAEEVGILNALSKGYRGADFKRMIEIFQDAGHSKAEIYPACPNNCWGTMWAHTNPDLEIVVTSAEGKEQHSFRLNEIVNPPAPALVFPSDAIKAIRKLSNSGSRSANQGDIPVIDNDYAWGGAGSDIIAPVTSCASDYREYKMTFDSPQFVFDSVAFGMKNGRVFGGFDVQSHYYKGYRAEEMAAISAMSNGNSNADFDVMVAVIPQFVEESQINAFLSMQWQTWGILDEFANPSVKIYAVNAADPENAMYVGTLSSLSTLLSKENITAAAKLKESKQRFDGQKCDLTQ